MGFLGRGSQLEGLGDRCNLPQRVPKRSSAAKKLSCISEAPDGLSWNSLGGGQGSGYHGPLAVLSSLVRWLAIRTFYGH